MHLDEFVALGRSGLSVSPLGLGTMTFGEGVAWQARVNKPAVILDRYVGLGGNYLDTGRGDEKPGAQTVVGNYLAQNSSQRDRLVMAAKFGVSQEDVGRGREAIIAECERTLRRLRTDHLDLFWLDNWDMQVPLDEILAGLNDLIQSGKLRYFGISDAPAWKVAHAQLIAQFHGWAPFIGLQIEYSLAARLFESELIPMARGMGLGVVSHSPLNGGLISGKYTRKNIGNLTSDGASPLAQHPDEQRLEIVDALIRIAAELDTTTARVALAWVLARPAVSSTIIGVHTLAQLDDDLGALDVQLSPEQTTTLDALTIPVHSLVLPVILQNAAPPSCVDYSMMNQRLS
ncbi:aldo/keto reductase [Rhizobium sp. A22-96]